MTTSQKIPVWYWIVSVLALLWNLLGVMMYLVQAYAPEMMMAGMSDAERELMQNIPAWVTAAYASAVFGGSAGSLGLLLRKTWAGILLWISWLGALVQFSHSFFMTDLIKVSGTGSIIGPVLILVIGLALIALARSARSKGWLS